MQRVDAFYFETYPKKRPNYYIYPSTLQSLSCKITFCCVLLNLEPNDRKLNNSNASLSDASMGGFKRQHKLSGEFLFFFLSRFSSRMFSNHIVSRLSSARSLFILDSLLLSVRFYQMFERKCDFSIFATVFFGKLEATSREVV